MSHKNFLLDESNPGWILGWGVVRIDPWDLAGIFVTKDDADAELAKRGSSYQIKIGSRELGSGNFIFNEGPAD